MNDLDDDDRVELVVVDTAVRRRAPYDLAPSRRTYAGILTFIRVTASLFVTLARRRPHVVHINTSGSLGLLRDIILIVLARGLGARVVGHLRFGRASEVFARGGWEYRLLSTFLRFSDICIAIDTPTLHTLRANVTTPCVLLPNYARARAKHGARAHEHKTVLFVGSVSRTKGIEDLLAAWATLNSGDWRLDVIGDFDPTYVDTVLREHRPQNVSFRGAIDRDEVILEMSKAEVFVLPSHTEGFPNVIVESMSVGTPVVATDVGAIPEMLAGGAGTVVAVQDVPALARALADLMESAPRRRSQGARGLDRFLEKYEASIVLEQYVSLWELAARPSGQGGRVRGRLHLLGRRS